MEQGLISRKLGAWFGHEEMRCIAWRCDHLEHLMYLRSRWLHLPPILAYYICFVPFAFVWYAALGSHQLACTGGRNPGWSFWISRGCLSSDSSGDIRPRVQGFMFKSDTYSSFFRVSWLKIPVGFYFEVLYIITGSSTANLLQCKRSNKRAVFWCCFDNWSPIQQSQHRNMRQGHWCDIQHCSIQLKSAQQQVAAVLAKGGEIYLALVKKDVCCREFRFNFTIKPYAIKSNVFHISYARIIIAYLYEINWDRAGHISGQRFTWNESACVCCVKVQ